jgi:diguanylate cyclase (GGDEF)-like protein
MNDRNTPKIRLSLTATPDRSVLVVDDDELVLARLGSLLKRGGYDVFTAKSCEEALVLLDRHSCNIVLADWEMPGMDGIALCRELRLSDTEQYTYLIILTGRSGKLDILTCLGAGADDYLARSASPEEVLARLEVGRRITRLEQSLRVSNEENRRLSETDSLTGAHNRQYLMRNLPRELERSRRYLHPISVLSCDLDDFKRINDRCGHEIGDQVLQSCIERIMSCLRTSMDWIARSGGDEFVIVLPETGLSGAQRVAEKICQAIATPTITTSSGQFSVTVSIGATALETAQELTETSVIELLRAVDKCLYTSKSLGRDRTTCTSISMAASVVRGAAETKHEIN